MKEAIKNSLSINEVAIKIFGYGNGTSYRKVKKYIIDNNIDISHFPEDPRSYKLTKYLRIEKICPICEKKFVTMQGHRDEKIVCSHSCANTYFRSGKSNPNYKGDEALNGKSKYVLICFRNHEKKCVCCDEKNIVEVHHYDGDKHNDKPENLVPMCPTHHRYWHSRFRYVIKKIVDDYVIMFKNKIEV